MMTLYLDMDGVLCDFDSHWVSLFGRTPLQSRDNKEFSDDWKSFIWNHQFEKLPWHPNGKELLEFVRSIPNLHIEMLTSSGGQKFHTSVREQKIVWLTKNGINYVPNVVPGRRLKSSYANASTILIDDTFDVIEAFNKAGGTGIHHTNIEDTKRQLLDAVATVS